MATEKERDDVTGTETTGHEWDGIRELDTPLPRWWLHVFYASILFSVVWWILYPSWPIGTDYLKGVIGYSQRMDFEESMDAARAEQAQYWDAIAAKEMAEIQQDEQLLTFALVGGESAFADNCAPCHGLGGAGQGYYPALGDDDWLWGGTLDEIAYTINHGIRNNDDDDARFSMMPAFGTDELLEGEQIDAVTAYVLSLSGADHDSATAAEGAVIYEENCAACHLEDGKGDIYQGAPNLTDAIWLYGDGAEAVRAQIYNPKHGVMPPWTGRLEDSTIKMLTLYVHGLGGGQIDE